MQVWDGGEHRQVWGLAHERHTWVHEDQVPDNTAMALVLDWYMYMECGGAAVGVTAWGVYR